MELLEIYVLCRDRSKKQALDFLDEFLPKRRALAENFPFPEYVDDPEVVFQAPETLISLLEERRDESYALYWQNQADGPVHQAMIFFTEDGGMMVGVVVDESDSKFWLQRLGKAVSGTYGYVNFESPPPGNTEEFKAVCSGAHESLMGGDE